MFSLSSRSGFATLEFAIAIGIIGIISSLSIPMYREYQIRSDLELATEQVRQALGRAKLLSQESQRDSTWGVCFPREVQGQMHEGAVLYKGFSCASRDRDFDEIYPMPTTITILKQDIDPEAILDVYFSKVEGVPSRQGFIQLTAINSDFRRIYIQGDEIDVTRGRAICVNGNTVQIEVGDPLPPGATEGPCEPPPGSSSSSFRSSSSSRTSAGSVSSGGFPPGGSSLSSSTSASIGGLSSSSSGGPPGGSSISSSTSASIGGLSSSRSSSSSVFVDPPRSSSSSSRASSSAMPSDWGLMTLEKMTEDYGDLGNVALSGNYAFVASYVSVWNNPNATSTIYAFDVSQSPLTLPGKNYPSLPPAISVLTPYRIYDIATHGNRLYVLTDNMTKEIRMYDISNPAAFSVSRLLVQGYNLPGRGLGRVLTVRDGTLYVGANDEAVSYEE